MAKKFKNSYDHECAILIAEKLRARDRSFPLAEFITADDFFAHGLPVGGPAFSRRQDIFAELLDQTLPPDYSAALTMDH